MKTIHDILNKLLEYDSRDIVPKLSVDDSGRTHFVRVPLYVTRNNNVYSYLSYSIPKHNYNYNDLVDEFIRLVYSDKEMFAIINNYLLDPENEVALNEFNEMQAIRKEAKDLAKSILADYPLN